MEERAPKTYADLSEAVTDFLWSDEVLDRYALLASSFKLPKGADLDIGKMTDEVVLGVSTVGDLSALLGKRFSLDVSNAQKRAADLAGYVLRSVDLPLGDIDAAIRGWGGDPDKYPRKVSAGIFIKDPILAHRLSLIADSYARGVRSAADMKAVLMRDTKIGGLELSEEEAQRVLVDLEKKKTSPQPRPRISDITPPVKPAPPPPAPKPKPKPVVVKLDLSFLNEEPAPAPKKPSATINAKGDFLATEEKKELDGLAEKTRKIHAEHPPLLKIEDALKEIVADAPLGKIDAEAKKRFERIVDAHLRDVRDAYETRTQIENPIDKGGLGLSGRRLVDVMEVMERVVGEYRHDLSEAARQGKLAAIQDKQEKAVARESKLQKKEEQVLAKRYAEVTGRAPASMGTNPVGNRASAAIEPEEALKKQEARLDMGKVKQAIAASRPSLTQATPRLSPASTPPSSTGRPKVQDVQFARTLSGPLEELQALTLVEFRRFAKDSTQAAAKILDKVDLLEQQGYDQKIAAIKAWRASPLHQMYVALTREALEAGKSVPQLLEQKQAAKEESLKPLELAAILKLNGSLRF